MKQRVILILILGALAGLGPARPLGAQETVERVTLDQAMHLFALHNLELRIARAEAREAVGLARQSAAYPNPSVAITHEALGSGVTASSETYFNLSQTLAWPWLASARRTAAARVADAVGARVAADSARLVFEVRRAFVSAAIAERTRDALQEATALVRQAEEQAIARGADGDISAYALRRLRVERARYEVDLSAATLALGARRRTLASLVRPDTEGEMAPAGLPDGGPPDVELADILSAAGHARPELAAAAGWAAAARGSRNAAGAARLPVPSVTAGYKEQSDGRTGVFLGLAVPLPLFDRNGAAVGAADAAVLAAEARRVLVARQVTNDVRQAHDAYIAARALAAPTQTDLLEDTDALLRIARVAYAEGELTLVELFDAVNAFRTAHVLAMAVLADLWVGYYDLERAVGAPLDSLIPPELR